MTFTDLLVGIGIMLLIEGSIIALMPKGWRNAVTQMLTQSDDTLRTFGLVFVLLGAALLWFVV
ncbi:DUF2065 domain-containing protein [Alphaproteobacteria bacterium]|jgi:uncharacterized protein YjeT (DUF2065 family)|nr:DUF2065 domain-containing protein [Alphaproteobacteria bacterium]